MDMDLASERCDSDRQERQPAQGQECGVTSGRARAAGSGEEEGGRQRETERDRERERDIYIYV